MPIEIDELTRSELIDLDRWIAARPQRLRHREAHERLRELRIGALAFQSEDRPPLAVMSTRYKKTTVDAGRWLRNA